MAKRTITPAELAALAEMGLDGLGWQVGRRNARMFCGYYGLCGVAQGTLAEVGEREALSKERTRQIVQRVRSKLGYVPEAAP